MRHKLLCLLLLSILGAGLGACAPELGDGCERSVDCSANGDRLCDQSQPGGYCTIANCEPGRCGSEGVCVRFRSDAPRLSSTWCMAACDSTNDCDRDEYVCRSAEQLNAPEVRASQQFAEVLDRDKGQKFCVVKY